MRIMEQSAFVELTIFKVILFNSGSLMHLNLN